ncbi:MAG: hypothetical protein LH615_13420 [Ferruginibacter sp.]|nr:hypothetical protein [Ferruginibacter sp.]
MTQGPGRFEYYLIQVDELLKKASKEVNPSQYLFKNDARTKFFMLEGLAKLYAGLHNKKLFTYVKDHFKALEDMLGAVDYFDAFAKSFLADAEIPSTIRMYMEEKREQEYEKINAYLVKKKWINKDAARTKKIRKKLKKADWQSPEKEIALITSYYKKEIEEINNFYKETGNAFTQMEEQVHELRRLLRWLSIYPQTLRGAIQLTENEVGDAAVKKYLTDDIVHSPFNIMPAVANNKVVLLLEKSYFLALSFVINALGKIKDSALQTVATADAVEHTQFVSKEIAMERACKYNHTTNDNLSGLLQKANELCAPFFAEDNLGKLVMGEINQN